MKTVKIKLDKNPDEVLENTNLYGYFLKLESEDRLLELPKPLMVYYVLNVLYDEILNGGFEQYLFNQFNSTYKYLEFCASNVTDTLLKDILFEYINLCKEFNIASEQITDKRLLQQLDELDNRFAELDEKYDLSKTFRKCYKELYTEKTIYFNVEIDDSNTNLKFYKWAKKGVTIENALDAFMSFLSKHDYVKWNITISMLFNTFTILAKSDEHIDLDSVINSWVDQKEYHNILYFKNFRIRNFYKSNQDELHINKSGYEKDEFMVERINCSRKFEQDCNCEIMLGAGNPPYVLDVKEYKMIDVYNYLNLNHKNYANILSVTLKNWLNF